MTDTDDEPLHTPTTGAWLWDKTKTTGLSIMLLVCVLGAFTAAASLWHVYVSPIPELLSYYVSGSWLYFVAFLMFTVEAWVAARSLHADD
jgi:hypothetical protein